MTKAPDRLDRAMDFWDRHATQPFLIGHKSLSLLSASIAVLRDHETFAIEHIHAVILAITLCEAQIRDCLRLAIDAPFIDFNFNNSLVKDIRLDVSLLLSFREHRFSIGEFFAVNISISTVERFWTGADLSFPGYDLPVCFSGWTQAAGLPSPASFDETKAALALVFAQRNQYVHEFTDVTASYIGTAENVAQTLAALNAVSLLLNFFQHLKEGQYDRAYSETAPSRAKVGKQLNALRGEIRQKLDELDTLLRGAPPTEYAYEAYEVRRAIFAFQAAHNDYLSSLSRLIAYGMGPGTIVNDFVYGAHLDALQEFDQRLKAILEHQRLLRGADS